MEDKNKKRSFRGIWLFGSGFIAAIILTAVVIYGSYLYFTQYYIDHEPPCDPEFEVAIEKSYEKNRVKNLIRAQTKLDIAETEYDRWLAIEDLAIYLVDAGELDKAREYANALLDIAPKFSKNWNYGNAIHKGHVALGRIELRMNNLEAAKQHLLDAGSTPGSPQLDSFGPNMLLAKELLEKDEREVVLQYLEHCRTFWKMGDSYLERWEKTIKNGSVPNFGANLMY
jgi:tetratricopeptide (TPR) repeat protein